MSGASREAKAHGPAASARRRAVIGMLAAVLVGVNMRPAITSVAAILDVITAQHGLLPVEVVLLSSLPIIAFGVSAPLVPLVAARVGIENTLLGAMVVLSLALWLRSLDESLLLPGTFLAGAAIMFGSVLVPPFLRSLAATPFWVGTTATMFALGAAAGAWSALPAFESMGHRVEPALAMWSIPALAAATGMSFAVLRGAQHLVRPAPSAPAIGPHSKLNGAVIVSFACMAMIYATLIAWLPVILQARGVDPGSAAAHLAWFNVAGLVPTMLLGVIASRRSTLLASVVGAGAAMAIALAWFAFDPHAPSWLLVTIIGLAQSSVFGITMLLLVRNERPGTSVLSATSQGVGYVLGAVASALAGGLQTWTGTWTASLWMLAGASVVLTLAAKRAVHNTP